MCSSFIIPFLYIILEQQQQQKSHNYCNVGFFIIIVIFRVSLDPLIGYSLKCIFFVLSNGSMVWKLSLLALMCSDVGIFYTPLLSDDHWSSN